MYELLLTAITLALTAILDLLAKQIFFQMQVDHSLIVLQASHLQLRLVVVQLLITDSTDLHCSLRASRQWIMSTADCRSASPCPLALVDGNFNNWFDCLSLQDTAHNITVKFDKTNEECKIRINSRTKKFLQNTKY